MTEQAVYFLTWLVHLAITLVALLQDFSWYKQNMYALRAYVNLHKKEEKKLKRKLKGKSLYFSPWSSLRTFAPIVSAHRYCARKFTRRHTRASAQSNKMNNDKADDLCYSFAWI